MARPTGPNRSEPGSRPAVAVVGATGVVGRTMIDILSEREFPLDELRLLASERSAGQNVSVGGRQVEIGLARPEAFEGVDLALLTSSDSIEPPTDPVLGGDDESFHFLLLLGVFGFDRFDVKLNLGDV